MLVLGIETSCDETAVGIVADGQRLLANVVASQADIHARYGGVVPEVASRHHIEAMLGVVKAALNTAKCKASDLDAVAVTAGPGLAGALLVGLNSAKALAYAWDKPLLGVNHLEGHIYANWLTEADPEFPAIILIVSGGHSEIVLAEGHGRYTLIGRTRDDAAGEAFDKAARALGLGFPGGPAIQRAAAGGDPNRFQFPRAWLKGTNDFSFSGLKTALLRKVQSFGFETTKPAPWQTTQIPEHHASPSNQPADTAERTVPKLPLSTVHLVDLSTFSAGNDAVSVPETAQSMPSPPPVK